MKKTVNNNEDNTDTKKNFNFNISNIINYKKIKNFLLFDNEKNITFNLYNGEIKKSEINNSINYIISESIIEIKSVIIPVVSKSLIKNIIFNTIKKHSISIPDIKDFDYKITDKIDNKYHIIVFIKKFNNNENNNIKYYPIYYILESLIKDDFFNEDSSFIINIGKEWFLYSFKERKFKKRDIYYKEDLSHLKNKNIYYLDLLNENNKKDYLKIPEDKIYNAICSLNKSIFKSDKSISNKKILIISSIIAAFIFIIILTSIRINLYFQKKEFSQTLNDLNKKFDDEKSSRGVNDEIYNKFISLINKKSNINEFFKYLFLTGKGNIEIINLNYTDEKNNFSISGICKNDLELENSFRKLKVWRNISFSFTRSSGQIKFNIQGEFTDE